MAHKVGEAYFDIFLKLDQTQVDAVRKQIGDKLNRQVEQANARMVKDNADTNAKLLRDDKATNNERSKSDIDLTRNRGKNSDTRRSTEERNILRLRRAESQAYSESRLHNRQRTNDSNIFSRLQSRLAGKFQQDQRKNEGSLHKLATQFRTIGTIARGISIGAAALGGFSLLQNLLGGIIAAGPLAAAGIALIPPALAAIGVEALIVRSAFKGVGKAISDGMNPAKAAAFQKDLQGLAPAARKFVIEITKAKGILPNIQQAFFSASSLQKAAARLRPFFEGIKRNFGRVATANGNLFGKLFGEAVSKKGTREINDFLGNLARLINKIAPSASKLFGSFINFADRVSKVLGGAGGDAISRVLDRISRFVDKINVPSLFKKAGIAFSAFGVVLKNIGGSIGGIIKAFGGTDNLGKIFFKNIGGLFKEINQFVNSKVGQTFLHQLVGTLSALSGLADKALKDGLSFLAGVFAGLYPAIKPFVTAAENLIHNVLTPEFGKLIGKIASDFLNLGTTILNTVTPAISGFINFLVKHPRVAEALAAGIVAIWLALKVSKGVSQIQTTIDGLTRVISWFGSKKAAQSKAGMQGIALAEGEMGAAGAKGSKAGWGLSGSGGLIGLSVLAGGALAFLTAGLSDPKGFDSFNKHMGGIKTDIEGVITGKPGSFKRLHDELFSLGLDFAQGGWVRNVGAGLGNFVLNVSNAATDVVGALSGKVVGFITKTVPSWFNTMATNANRFLQNSVGNVNSWATTIVSSTTATLGHFVTKTIPSFFGTMRSGIAGIIGAVLKNIHTWWGSVAGFFSGTVKNFITTTVPSWWGSMRTFIGQRISGILGDIKTWWSGVAGFFTGTVQTFVTKTIPGFFATMKTNIIGNFAGLAQGIIDKVKSGIGGLGNFFTGTLPKLLGLGGGGNSKNPSPVPPGKVPIPRLNGGGFGRSGFPGLQQLQNLGGISFGSLGSKLKTLSGQFANVDSAMNTTTAHAIIWGKQFPLNIGTGVDNTGRHVKAVPAVYTTPIVNALNTTQKQSGISWGQIVKATTGGISGVGGQVAKLPAVFTKPTQSQYNIVQGATGAMWSHINTSWKSGQAGVGTTVGKLPSQTTDPIKKTYNQIMGATASAWNNVGGQTGKGVGNVGKLSAQLPRSAGPGVAGLVRLYSQNIKKVWDSIAKPLKLSGLGSVAFAASRVASAAVGAPPRISAFHFATGGPVRGPGGPKDDRIHAMLSDGEFVTNAASTKRHRGLLEAINNNRIPHMFGGGLISVAQQNSVSEIEAFERAIGGGLRVTSTTGGQHAPNSFHYRGEAVDFAGGGMDQVAAKLMNFGGAMLEMFHSPHWFIKNGRVSHPIDFATHFNHIHLAMTREGARAALAAVRAGKTIPPLGGPGGGFNFGGAGSFNVASGMSAAQLKGILDAAKRDIPGNSGWATLLRGIPNMLVPELKALSDKAAAKINASFNALGAAAGNGKVSAWIAEASKFANIPASWIPGIKTIISRESGGNPRSVNRTDANARAGHPSQGLMQTIPSTFNRYVPAALRSRGIFDPVANIAAAVNYIRARYGSIFNVQQANPNRPPRGYRHGTNGARRGWAMVGENGPEMEWFDGGETIVPHHLLGTPLSKLTGYASGTVKKSSTLPKSLMNLINNISVNFVKSSSTIQSSADALVKAIDGNTLARKRRGSIDKTIKNSAAALKKLADKLGVSNATVSSRSTTQGNIKTSLQGFGDITAIPFTAGKGAAGQFISGLKSAKTRQSKYTAAIKKAAKLGLSPDNIATLTASADGESIIESLALGSSSQLKQINKLTGQISSAASSQSASATTTVYVKAVKLNAAETKKLTAQMKKLANSLEGRVGKQLGIHKASGGFVPRVPGVFGDNVPVLATPGEYITPVGAKLPGTAPTDIDVMVYVDGEKARARAVVKENNRSIIQGFSRR